MTDNIEHTDYNHKVIDILGEVSVTIKSAGWTTKAKFSVVEKARCLMGLDYQREIGIRNSQIQNPDSQCSSAVAQSTEHIPSTAE